ncbi:MAG: family 16 glycoside hydrolase [Planctomycetota bacterium]|jgi:glucose/arabinose dehydrogenase
MILPALLLALAAPQTEQDYYTVEYLTPPDGEILEVGGMDFLSNGTLLVSTRRGRVWWIDNPMAEDPADAQFHIFAEGLHEGLGLKVVEDRIYVMQRGELSQLIDTDGDKVCDRVETISQAWGMSGNYHEFAFGLPVDAAGNFYVSTNVGFWSPEWWHGLSREPYRGWIMRIAPDGDMTPLAHGVRSPAGLGLDVEGNLYYTDNQGDWMPACGLFHVQEGDFFGHPASLRWTEAYGNGETVPSSLEPPQVERTPPAVWIPYEYSRSTGSLVPDTTAGAFGPFQEQLFVAELTNGLVFRTLLEEVQGRKQGAVVLFRQDVGSALRVRFAPDGSLFVGMTNRGWGGLAPGHGIARLRWTGQMPLEYQSIHLQQDGFELGFTLPLERAPDPATIAARDYDYNWWWDYGSPEMRGRELEVSSSELSEDGKTLRIVIPGLKAGRNVRVSIPGIGLLHEEFDYTLNQLPEGPLSREYVAKEVAPPAVRESDEEGWLTLTWSDPFDAWQSEGWKLMDVALDPDDQSRFLETPGNGALVNTGNPRSDFRSKGAFGDIAFRFNFMLPEGGDSGLYLQDRYELQLVDDPGACCGIIDAKGPRAKGYRGPGQWHTVTGRFYAPRFDESGNKTANARFEEITVDGVMVVGATECEEPTGGAVSSDEVPFGPLRFQGNAGLAAIGDVRVKKLSSGEAAHDGLDWKPVELLVSEVGDFELSARCTLSDGGAAALEFHVPNAQSDGWSLVLDHTGPGPLRTGSIAGHAPITTQFLQPGVPFDLILRCRTVQEQTRLQVLLNGVEVQDVLVPQLSPGGFFRIDPAVVPGTELEIETLEYHSY